MPEPVDLEAFLESRRRLTRTVQFHRADDLAERQEDLQRRTDAAEAAVRAQRTGDAAVERSMDEPDPNAQLRDLDAEWTALAAEWDERGSSVVVEERTKAELSALTRPMRRQYEKDLAKARKAGGDGAHLREQHAEQMLLTQLVECLVEPAFTVEQLTTLRRSSVAGEKAVDQMWNAVVEVCAIPAGPFSRQPSPTPAGDSSAPS
ncbi:hypothetical protein [Pseudokineococcus lusitanus]|uniref:Uncharacterized protein n=1 Tax=Pseudokineococcus lusitanus TaxID=763993 RepID=A0A3N1HTW7_9ACTN|nr:hypothetical protein [Pseudokineococcus lusitanus]ROP45951.1 hypothetical protein EDC03_0567 [Pseudokineococcus lusitanus]